jgi:hypothetical protein
VLRRNIVQRPRQMCRTAKCAPHAVPRHLNQSLRFGKSVRTTRMKEWSKTELQTCHMYRVTDKSVRQCARRCAHHISVAQASPLFSDHAPKEVHLWQ